MNWFFNFFRKKKKKNLIWYHIHTNQYVGVIGYIPTSNYSWRQYGTPYNFVKGKDNS
jgi:hypothetical protein